MTEDTTKEDASLGPTSQMSDAPSERGEKEEGNETRIYEVGYLILPTVPEGELPREVTTLKDALDKEKAAIIAEEFPKLRTLAYIMQKRSGEKHEQHSNGYFGWIKFEASPKSALQIEQAFKQNKLVLRYLLIKTVREHTLTAGRPRVDRRERRDAPQGVSAKAPVSEVELDKSIEKLIAE